MGSVSEDEARSATAEHLYEVINKTLDDVNDKDPQFRIPFIKDLADAYAAVTFGIRKH
ncbi:hypothetical protein ABZ901_00735 [Actinacidiphila alni]|uniref:hypothetical protein n=1 Tax=Actinacidiphila alni TaxID=380248 RepID=UPI0033E7C373